VPRNRWRFAVLTMAALLTSTPAVRSQSLVPQPTPESHVIEAKRVLGDIAASPTSESGKQIALLQIHFTDFATAFLTGGGPITRSGIAGTAGTSGTASSSDWRNKYATVERDLTALIGSPDPASPERGDASLDPTVRKQLQTVRKNLQLFYAATMGRTAGHEKR